jgi:16S rRNA (cytosine967-C5)-methyltransferase
LTARDIALFQLDGKRLPGWKPNLLHGPKSSSPAEPRDWALAEQIVAGVVKNLLLLRHHVEHYSARPIARIDPLVAKILAVAMYQLKFLDRVPASAAVDQAVQQAKRFGRRRSAGFVNAVLRNVARQPPPAAPDPADDPQKYAELVLSHPPALFRRLVKLLGTERALSLCRHDNAEPPTIVRLFPGVEATALAAPGVEIEPHEREGLVVVRGAARAVFARWARMGLGQVQDATAAGVARHLQISPGQVVLDRCAGLGTKTLQIQAQVGPSGQVFAIEPSAFRVAALRRLLEERGITNVKILQTAKLDAVADEIPDFFERILIDVPCSNSGVLARRPEARYAVGLDSLVKLQRTILDDTVSRLQTGGILVYSTCSVWPEENETQINDFLGRNRGLTLVGQESILPSFQTADPRAYHDGGYIAVVQKR